MSIWTTACLSEEVIHPITGNERGSLYAFHWAIEPKFQHLWWIHASLGLYVSQLWTWPCLWALPVSSIIAQESALTVIFLLGNSINKPRTGVIELSMLQRRNQQNTKSYGSSINRSSSLNYRGNLIVSTGCCTGYWEHYKWSQSSITPEVRYHFHIVPAALAQPSLPIITTAITYV